MTASLDDIYTELVKLNETLEILTAEHIKHFKEWREKNLNSKD